MNIYEFKSAGAKVQVTGYRSQVTGDKYDKSHMYFFTVDLWPVTHTLALPNSNIVGHHFLVTLFLRKMQLPSTYYLPLATWRWKDDKRWVILTMQLIMNNQLLLFLRGVNTNFS